MGNWSGIMGPHLPSSRCATPCSSCIGVALQQYQYVIHVPLLPCPMKPG